MKKIVLSLCVLTALSSCGADGEPTAPEVGVSTSVGVNSKTGLHTDTSVNIHFPLN